MALKTDVERESGLVIDDAYLRVVKFSGTKSYLDFTLNIYVNRQAYDKGRYAVSSKFYNMSFDKDRNLFRQMHEYLRALPEYEDAVEAIGGAYCVIYKTPNKRVCFLCRLLIY